MFPLGKYPIFRQLSKIFGSSSIAGSGWFFRAMYGMMSSAGFIFKRFQCPVCVLAGDGSRVFIRWCRHGTVWSEVLFHGFGPNVDFCFVFMVEVYVGVGSVDLGQLGSEGVGGFPF